MGYCVEMKECKFFIKKENIEKAFNTLRDYAKTKIENKERLSWIDLHSVAYSETLTEALESCDFDILYNDNGDVYDVDYISEKLGDHDVILNVIAPYIEDGSYLQMYGEDGDTWRWCIKDNKCYWKTPKIIWE